MILFLISQMSSLSLTKNQIKNSLTKVKANNQIKNTLAKLKANTQVKSIPTSSSTTQVDIIAICNGSTPSLSAGEACFYTGLCWQGTAKCYQSKSGNVYPPISNTSSTMGTSSIRSISLGSGTKVTIFSGTSYTGTSNSYTSNQGSLSLDQNVHSVTFAPIEGCVIFFQNIYYGGWSFEACNSYSSLGSSSGAKKFLNSITGSITYNDAFSSVILGYNTGTEMFQNGNFGGNSYVVKDDIPDFTKINFNDEVSSFIIRPPYGCVKAWTGCNYTGDNVTFCSSETLPSPVHKNLGSFKPGVGVKGVTVTFSPALYSDFWFAMDNTIDGNSCMNGGQSYANTMTISTY